MRKFACVVLLVGLVCIAGCNGGQAKKDVVLYCALDQIFSEPVMAQFQNQSGVKLKPVFDTEAAKTVGLVNRIIAEKDNPQCDVFWNNEIVRTIVLKKKGLLQSYVSPQAEKIPELFKDKQGFWAGFGARARVLIYNKNLLTAEQLPKSIFDLTRPEWKGKVVMALPLFGTTATHASALFVALGNEKALKYFQDLKDNGVKIVSGNASARDMVARGEYPMAFTDTDDVYEAITGKEPVGVIFPDQGPDGMGTLLIPNTVAMVAGSKHPDEARAFIDYLVSAPTEQALALCGSAQIPVRAGLKKADGGWALEDIKAQQVDWDAVADRMEPVAVAMRKLFVE